MFSFTFSIEEECPTMRFWLGHNSIANVRFYKQTGKFRIKLCSEFGNIYDKNDKRETIEFLMERFMLSYDTFATPVKMLTMIIKEFKSPITSTLIMEEDNKFVVIKSNGLELGRFSSLDEACNFANLFSP